MDLQWGIILQIIQRVCIILLVQTLCQCIRFRELNVPCLLSYQACADPGTLSSCNDWLKGSVLGEKLLGLTEELCKVGHCSPTSAAPTSSHGWTLISLVLSQPHNNGEHTVSHTTECFLYLLCLLPFVDFEISHQNHIIISICFYVHSASDRGGVHGEDLREASRHSVGDQESVRCREHGATHLLHLRCSFHILFFCTRLSCAALC